MGFSNTFSICKCSAKFIAEFCCAVNLKRLRPTGVNFVNIICAPFLYESLFSSYVLALNKLSYEKRARKTFMKFTPGVDIHWLGHPRFGFHVILFISPANWFSCSVSKFLVNCHDKVP